MHRTHNHATADVAQAWRDAALYLERHGWTQRALYRRSDNTQPDPTPAACAVGAIRCAIFGGPIVTATCDQMSQLDPIVGVLADHVHDPGNDTPAETGEWGPASWESPNAIVTDWNDAHGRTANEVIASLRAAADDWDRIHGDAR